MPPTLALVNFWQKYGRPTQLAGDSSRVNDDRRTPIYSTSGLLGPQGMKMYKNTAKAPETPLRILRSVITTRRESMGKNLVGLRGKQNWKKGQYGIQNVTSFLQ